MRKRIWFSMLVIFAIIFLSTIFSRIFASRFFAICAFQIQIYRIFDISWSKYSSNYEKDLKYHIAEKKINYIDDNGMLKKPMNVNGLKLEKFIFDAFQFAKYIFS